MMDRILIDALEAETCIGIYTWERRVRQRVLLDLEMAVDVSRAAAADRIEATLDYQVIAKQVREHVEQAGYGLVESLAESVAGLIRERFQVPWVRVTVRKPGAVTGAAGVGVTIERGRADG